jgi:hypothetical protein
VNRDWARTEKTDHPSDSLRSIFVVVVFTTSIDRPVRRDREQVENDCPDR